MTEETKTRILRNGAIYDNETKRIIGMDKSKAEVNTLITPDNSRAMQARRWEVKREKIMAGANAALREHPTYAALFDGKDLDFVEAGAQAVMYKALDKLDPKQVDAFRAILQEAGLAEKQSLDQTDAPQLASLLGSVAAAAVEAAIRAGRMEPVQVIDGDVIPMRQDTGQDDG